MAQPLEHHWELGCLDYVAGYYSSTRRLDLAQKGRWVGLELTPGVGELLAEKAPLEDSLRGSNTERVQGFGIANYPLSVAVADIGHSTILRHAYHRFRTEFVTLAGHKYVRLVSYYTPTLDRHYRSSPLVQHSRCP